MVVLERVLFLHGNIGTGRDNWYYSHLEKWNNSIITLLQELPRKFGTERDPIGF